MLEAIALCERIAGRELDWTLSDEARIGDHRWWISDLGAFQRDYPDWRLTYGIEDVLREIHDAERRALDARGRGAMKLSVVIPAHNEEGSIAATRRRRSPRRSRRGRSTTRSSSSTTRPRDGTGDASSPRSREARPARALRALAVPQRLRLRGPRRASTPSRATPSRS